MPKLKSKVKTYGFCLGIIIIGITTTIGVMTATPLDKGKVHLNIQMATSLVSCVCIGITVLTLTRNVFVNMYFGQDTGLWLFILLLFQLLLIIDAELKRDFWLIFIVCLNMALIFVFIYMITSFYEIWKNWKEEIGNRELYLWKIIYGKPSASRDVQTYRIPLSGSLVKSSTSSRKYDDDDDDYEWEWNSKFPKQSGNFKWSVYSVSTKGSVDTLYSEVTEELYGKQTRDRNNDLTYHCINDAAVENDPITKECESEETVENIIGPSNSDEGTQINN